MAENPNPEKPDRITRAEAQEIAREESGRAVSEGMKARFRECPGCGSLIPKAHDDCPRCGLVWDPEAEEFKPKPQPAPAPDPEAEEPREDDDPLSIL